MSGDDYDQLQADPEEVTRRFTQVILQETQRWIEMADDKLRGKVHRVIVCPANDDMFELDPLLHQQGHVVESNDQDPLDLDGFQIISLGWTNPPRGTRSASYPRMSWPSGGTNWSPRAPADPSRTIFNFHALPYRSGLDEAPALAENLNMKADGRAMQPVGSTSVRTAIERVSRCWGCMARSTKTGERYGSAGRWHSTQGAATKRACRRARSSHPTRKAKIKTCWSTDRTDRNSRHG